MTGHTVSVFVNGERFPLLCDRRFHVGAYFAEGTDILDNVFNPPRALRMSQMEPGVTAVKLQANGRYIAVPGRPTLPAVVLHNVPEAATPIQIGQWLEQALDGAFIEECNVYRTAVTDKSCSTRAYVVFRQQAAVQTLVRAKQVVWPEMNAILSVEQLDVPRPVPPTRRGRGGAGPGQQSPVAALATSSRTLAAEGQVTVPVPERKTHYFVQLIDDVQSTLSDWVAQGVALCATENVGHYEQAARRGPVVLLFAIPAKQEVFGYGLYHGPTSNTPSAEANADALPATETNGSGVATSSKAADASPPPAGGLVVCKVDWVQYGAAVKKSQIDTCVRADVAADLPDGCPVRPDWGADICVAVNRSFVPGGLRQPGGEASMPSPHQPQQQQQQQQQPGSTGGWYGSHGYGGPPTAGKYHQGSGYTGGRGGSGGGGAPTPEYSPRGGGGGGGGYGGIGYARGGGGNSGGYVGAGRGGRASMSRGGGGM